MQWLSSAEAAHRLGVKRTTLYSYVSRGWIRTSEGGDARSRRYFAEDIDALQVRASVSRGERAAAAGAVDWGAPVLDSAITSIDVEGPNYRGVSALTLAERRVPFESVATLLWTGKPEDAARFGANGFGVSLEAVRGLIPEGRHVLGVLGLLVAAWGARAPVGLDEVGALDAAGTLLRRLAASCAWVGRVDGREERVRASLAATSMAEAVAVAMGAPLEQEGLVESALVLCADHELNASSFAARVAAGTGADLHACVGAALATLSGPRHGRASDRVEDLLDVAATGGVAQALERYDGAPPGFGHRLYGEGDPRGAWLLERAGGTTGRARLLTEVVAAVGTPGPSLDVGLVAVRMAAGLPRGAGAALFAVGRAAGWIAHAREQAAQGELIRPRARYVGP